MRTSIGAPGSWSSTGREATAGCRCRCFITATELANGFFNRFLVIAVQCSKELPFGGRLAGDDLARVRDAVLTALRFAAFPRQVTFDPQARDRWIDVYGPLSRGEEGLLGAATRRAEAHVVRLAAIYASLDCAARIGLPHLEGALAVWRYSADSARWIFGDSLGDPPPTRSGHSPRPAPPASRAPTSATSSAATRKPARSNAP